MQQESRTLKQILEDWWVLECGGKKIPQGQEVDLFCVLIAELSKIGYTRNQIERVSSMAVEYGINKKAMPKWKLRMQILQRYYKEAVSLTVGAKSDNSADKPAAEDQIEETLTESAEGAAVIPVDPVEIEKSTPGTAHRPNQTILEEISNRFKWHGDDDDIM